MRFLLTSLVLLLGGAAEAQSIHVSTDAAGLGHPGRSVTPEVADDGRWVVFRSYADLAPFASVQNFVHNVYVKDLWTGSVVTIDVAPGGVATNGDARDVSISANGRFVAFETEANNLVSPAGAGIVLHDRDPDGNGVYDEGNGTSVLASRNLAGNPAWPPAADVDLSADGRSVGFHTGDPNMVLNDTNGASDAFVYDRLTGATVRVSVATGGGEALGSTGHCVLSADGRFAAYESNASNLAPGDTGWWDVFRHDRDPDGNGVFDEGNGVTVLVSGPWKPGISGNLDSGRPDLSADGDVVAFQSGAVDLVPGFIFSDARIYARRMSLGATTLVSVNDLMQSATTHSRNPRVSADGRFVVFDTQSANLSPADGNGHEDVFVRDLWSFRTTRLSFGLGGAGPDANSAMATLSGNGAVVAWHSAASNMAASDTNGDLDVFAVSAWSPACVAAGAAVFGTGLAGTFGVPSLGTTGSPQLGGAFSLDVGNSLGADTGALLLLGNVPTAFPTLGGVLLVHPTWAVPFGLPAAGASLVSAVPNSPALCGAAVLCQVFESDPGAPHDVSMTRGVAITIGL